MYDLVQAEYKNEYCIKYIVYESKCPKCGEFEEHHIEAEAEFFKKEIKCYKCKHIYICEAKN